MGSQFKPNSEYWVALAASEGRIQLLLERAECGGFWRVGRKSEVLDLLVSNLTEPDRRGIRGQASSLYVR